MFPYQFKTKAEVIWFVLTTLGVALAQAFIANTNGNMPSDWRVYLVAVLGGAIRPIVGIVLGSQTTQEGSNHG